MSNLTEQTPLNPEALKKRLEQYCETHEVTKFEPDEIIELIEDGEAVDWLVEQIVEDAEPPEELVILLTDLKTVYHPEEGDLELEMPEAEGETTADIETPPAAEEAPMDELSMLEGLELPPGVDMEQVKKLMESPQGNIMADFSLFCQEKGVAADSMDKSTMKKIDALREEWMDTPREQFEGKTPREVLAENPEMTMPGKVETFRREAPKVGRNDPCPCGSGKKYKKCCGKGL